MLEIKTADQLVDPNLDSRWALRRAGSVAVTTSGTRSSSASFCTRRAHVDSLRGDG